MTKKKGPGRPRLKDAKEAITVRLHPKLIKRLEREHGSARVGIAKILDKYCAAENVSKILHKHYGES